MTKELWNMKFSYVWKVGIVNIVLLLLLFSFLQVNSRKQYHKALFLLSLRVLSTRRGKPVSKRVGQLLTCHTVRKQREGSWRSDSPLFSLESQHMEWYQPQFGWVFPPQSTQYVKKLPQSAHGIVSRVTGAPVELWLNYQPSQIPMALLSSKCLHQASVIVTKPDF